MAYTFGSVPLKTYLPDGDIDLAVFQVKGPANALKDTWYQQLAAVMQEEQHNPHALLKVTDVQVIHAEVRPCGKLRENLEAYENSSASSKLLCTGEAAQVPGIQHCCGHLLPNAGRPMHRQLP